jgi:hypothetical protein
VKVKSEGNISEKLWEFPVVVHTIFTYFSVSIMEKVMMHLAICYSRRGTIAIRDYCLVKHAQRAWRCVAISCLQQMSAIAT